MTQEITPSTPDPLPSEQQLRAIAIFDIDGVVRDVADSYLRALADTVEHYTKQAYRPTLAEVDVLKAEGRWNNDWEASQELIYRFFEAQGESRATVALDYQALVDFFQDRYRGKNWTGYIQDEPLLLSSDYLADLAQAEISWGFFSGATRGSATFVLEKRLGLQQPILVAMEDAPGKPDPTGLIETARQLGAGEVAEIPVIYVGDTVADLQTVQQARMLQPQRVWIGVGVIPPHVQNRSSYASQLQDSGAAVVLNNVEQLTPEKIFQLLAPAEVG